MNISSIRKDYTLKSLEINEVNVSPFAQFHSWFEEALASKVLEVNAMTLSTLGLDGCPVGRIVLLKELDHGFVFFTNYESQKGKEIQTNPKASLTFFWPELERQVRVSGVIGKIEVAQSDEYFFSRPKGSQLGAWTSPQSQVIASRDELENNLKKVTARFEKEKITRPPFWGGYRLIPKSIEFWQGRPSRLHDRLRYDLQDGEKWKISRLAP